MICLLCFGVERDELFIDITSEEGRRFDIASIIHRYFDNCFQREPIDGCVCRKCWVQLSCFHEFHIHIENIQRSQECIFAENIIDDIKSPVDSENDDTFFVFDGPSPHDSDTMPVKMETQPEIAHTTVKYPDSDDGIDDNFEMHFMAPKPKLEKKKKKKKPTKKKETNKENQTKRKWTRRVPKTEPDTFQCKTCELHFLSFCRLDRHVKEMHDIRAFRCTDTKCVDSFDTQLLLDIHVEARHKRTECPQCQKSVLERFLSKHIEYRHGSAHIICELCGKVSLNKQMHKEHYETAHMVMEKLQCDICSQLFRNRAGIRSHMTNKHIYGPQTCNECGHVSPNRKALIEHRRLHKPGAKDRWRCDKCGHGFRERKKLEEHYHIHTGTAGSYHCEHCGKIFRFSSSFSVHKKKMHPK